MGLIFAVEIKDINKKQVFVLNENELILYYGLDNTQKKILETTLAGIGIVCREIFANQVNCPISSLLDAKVQDCQDDNYKSTESAESVAILNGLSDERINEFLAAIRTAKGLNVELKAVVTEHNMNWKFSELIDELRQENTVMKIYMAVRSQVRTVRQWLADENLAQSSLPSIVQWRQEIGQAADDAQTVMTDGEGSGEMDVGLLENCNRVLSELMSRTFD